MRPMSVWLTGWSVGSLRNIGKKQSSRNNARERPRSYRVSPMATAMAITTAARQIRTEVGNISQRALLAKAFAVACTIACDVIVAPLVPSIPCTLCLARIWFSVSVNAA